MKNLPNLLGLFRIITTPLLMGLILWGTAAGYLASFVLLLLMAVSDILDGRLARKYQVVSPLGVFLDTTSDKIFVTATLIPMVHNQLMGWPGPWIAAVIIIRDFVISGLRSFAAAEGEVISARQWGKQKLVITVTALCWLLVASAGRLIPATPALLQWFFDLWWIPMVLTLIWTVGSGLEYIWKAWPLLMGRRTVPASPAPAPPAKRTALPGGRRRSRKAARASR